jgi:hypothetical protein
MLKRTLIAALLMMVATLSNAANPRPAPDPAIGSYFWFVALNQRCEAADPARDAALARFRTHFLDNGKRIAASLPAASATGFLSALNDMEKNGPPKESMDHVNAILAQVSPAETRQLCQRAAADIDDRIGIENKLAQAQAQSSVWRGEDGKPIAETQSMKSQNDFAGSMLLTTDEDWQEKWNTPPENKPHYNQANVVPYGKKVFTMIFFSNPLRDTDGVVNVKCGLKISDPSGKVSFDQQDMVCYNGKLAGSPYHLYLGAQVVAFSGDPGDPSGTWSVDVTLRDENRHVTLPLRSTFELK